MGKKADRLKNEILKLADSYEQMAKRRRDAAKTSRGNMCELLATASEFEVIAKRLRKIVRDYE